jgi:hypothetical protein
VRKERKEEEKRGRTPRFLLFLLLPILPTLSIPRTSFGSTPVLLFVKRGGEKVEGKEGAGEGVGPSGSFERELARVKRAFLSVAVTRLKQQEEQVQL